MNTEVYKINIETVRFYPYRTACICPILKIKENMIPDLRERLASFCDKQTDLI